MADRKSRGWITIVYPESADKNWFSILSEIGLQSIVSPLHSLDVNADGSPKKPHYHVLLLWDAPTTYSNAQNYVDMISGVGCIAMASLRGSARYFCHLDNPEKHRYDTSEVRTTGGLCYDDLITSATDDLLILYEIFDFIDEVLITSYRQLLIYARQERPDWAKLILTKHRENVIAYQKSLQWEIDQDVIPMPAGMEADVNTSI